MKKLILALMVLGLTACDEKKDVSKEVVPAQVLENENVKVTSFDGQVYYTEEEIINNDTVGFRNQVAEYRLDNLRINIISKNKVYVMYPDYDGLFGMNEIEPGSYQIIIQSFEEFSDENGKYSYQFMTNLRLKEGGHTVLPLMHVKKVYIDQQ